MSVQTWKKIITLTVVGIIIILLAVSIVNIVKVGELTKELEGTIPLCDDPATTTDESGADGIVDPRDKEYDKSDYQTWYKGLYVENDFEFTDDENEKVCYLTFDDGPNTTITPKVLDTLKKYDVKATFFVISPKSDETESLYKRIVDEGHTIGVHTASHKYEYIYSSAENYLKDFNKVSERVENATGVKPEIFRFPGGSVNSYNIGIYMQLISEMYRRGYVPYDWNISSGDAAASYVSADDIVRNVVEKGQNINKKIVLMHDGKGHGTTAEALPRIIEGLQAQGYTFKALDNNVRPVLFGYSS